MYDAIVVGARCAGSSTAMLLARKGYRADYERQGDEWAMPFYELTCGMATFAPPPPEMTAIYEALRGNAHDTSRFIGLITEAISPTEFFAAENVLRIVAGG